MGTDQRIPLFIGTDEAPIAPALIRDASQPPMGARYRDETGNYTSCASVAATVLDLRAGGIEYDPYNLMDLTNNRVKLPMPGVWDIGIEIVTGPVAIGGDNVYVQFSRDNTGVDAQGQMVAFQQTAADGQYLRLLISTQFYVTRELLGDGDLFYTTCYNASGSATNVKIVTLSMWLRSANVPGRY